MAYESFGNPEDEAMLQIAGEPVPLPYTLDDMAEDAVGLLDAIRIQRAHIVGVSMGGAIAQLVAIDEPGLAARILKDAGL